GETREAETNLRELRRKQSRMREEESSAYMDYRSGSILQEEYAAAKRHREDALRKLQKAEEERKKQIRVLEKQAEKYLTAVKVLMDFGFDRDMTGEMLRTYIDKILVYPGKRVEVHFAFTADWLRR
ncbi:MAG: DNA invertase, partial [Lachnospiraceae bacterium]|nr:DNA invertase [Lachnospiraceae bacterium]